MSDTPESDAMAEQCYHQINVPTNPVPAEFARMMERERNEARQLAKGYGLRLLAISHDFGLNDTHESINDHIAGHPEIFNQTKDA